MTRDTQKYKAYQYIYNQIISYRMKPGISIVEKAVADVLKISRTPVREALNQLESEGLVKHFPGRGCFVSEVEDKDIGDIFFIRKTLELAALEISLPEITEEELADIEQRIHNLKDSINTEAAYQLDKQFHQMIVQHTCNKRLINIINSLNIHVERFRRLASFNTDRPSQTNKEHLAIIHAIKTRDYELAKEQLALHLDNVKQNALLVYRTCFS